MNEDIKTNCPICGKPMTKGKLLGGGLYSLKWLPYHKRPFLAFLPPGGDTIDSRCFFSFARPFAIGYRCPSCRKIIISIGEKSKKRFFIYV